MVSPNKCGKINKKRCANRHYRDGSWMLAPRRGGLEAAEASNVSPFRWFNTKRPPDFRRSFLYVCYQPSAAARVWIMVSIT